MVLYKSNVNQRSKEPKFNNINISLKSERGPLDMVTIWSLMTKGKTVSVEC